MDAAYENNAVVVKSEATSVVNDVPINSRTAGRRTLAKYLKKKSNIVKFLEKEEKEIEKGSSLTSTIGVSSALETAYKRASEFPVSFCNTDCSQDLSMALPSNIPTYINSFNANHSLFNGENPENHSSIGEMLRCVIEGNRGYLDSIENIQEYPPHWIANSIPFNFCDSQITSSSLSASIDKQEREIAYNLLVRRIIDETLDRNVIFSHQPKELLNMINSILMRQFSENEESKHRSKVRSYLKACRRNSKKNNGKILMKNTAAYLSSGPGNRLMHQIYNREKEAIDTIKKESERLKILEMSKRTQNQTAIIMTSSTQISTTQPRHIISIANNLPSILPASKSSVQSNFRPVTKIFTSTSEVNVTQLPLLMPFNSTIHTESVKKTSINSEYSTSEEIVKSISEIAQTFVDKDSGLNLKEIVNQLKETSKFLNKIASTLEHSLNKSKP